MKGLMTGIMMATALMAAGCGKSGQNNGSGPDNVDKAVADPAKRDAGSSIAAAEATTTARLKAWQGAGILLRDADVKTMEAVDRHQRSIHTFFEERKRGAGTFADEALGTYSKFMTAGAAVQGVVNYVGALCGASTASKGWDAQYLEERFRADVVSELQVDEVLRRAMDSFLADVRRIEAELFVKIRADLSDEDIRIDVTLPPVMPEGRGNEHFSFAMQLARETASADLLVQGGLFVSSQVVGNYLGAQVTPESSGLLISQGINYLVGNQVDRAADGAVRSAGYRPKDKIVSAVGAAMDSLCDRATVGGPKSRQIYLCFYVFANYHPDAAVRAATEKAMASLERGDGIGLINRMNVIAFRRSALRFKLIHTQVVGIVPAWSYASTRDMTGWPDAATIIKAAGIVVSRNGGVAR